MRSSLLIGLLLLAAAGCNDRFSFKSMATVPTGEPVDLRYRLKVGDRFRMTSYCRTSSPSGRGSLTDFTTDVTLKLLYRCEEILQDGSIRLSVDVEDLSRTTRGGGRTGTTSRPEEVFGDHGGSIILSPLGECRFVNASGETGDIGTEELLDPLREVQGFGFFVVYPEGGIRIGEAISFDRLLSSHLQGGEVEGHGELVLTGVEGEEVAVFAVNAVGRSHSIREGGKTDVRSRARIEGTYRISTATGMLTGESTQKLEQDSTVTTGAGSHSSELTKQGTITVTKLPAE